MRCGFSFKSLPRGLFILPHRRRKAKAELKEKIAALRLEIITALKAQFETEAGHFILSEHETLLESRECRGFP